MLLYTGWIVKLIYSSFIRNNYLQVWGKLLHGFLRQLSRALKLKGEDELLQYVRDKELYKSPVGHADVVWERQGLLGIMYQCYTETTTDDFNHYPPDTEAGK